MNANPGFNIAKALRAFTKEAWGVMDGISRMTARESDEISIWVMPSYPETLRALMKLPDFAGDERMADAYICGYYRGLQKAAFLLQKRKRKA